ncbi:inositol monophosphatase family protein [Fundicoccus culcitae]|uniref:Inositol monophosphatase family protein n=1 Tax=Fundicoccus culcitae TaxID=2969821 RepID=A0ABY5P637_9LACT|nr:inositol monophosphatase family protein [Fundicoccus culcitae]UUX33888.1 inositol monophosphatase family protein [Fundicoccus culcitae]
MTLKDKHFFALAIISQAYDIIKASTKVAVETKAHSRDLVTVVDKTVQEHINQAIQTQYPDDQIIGEENWTGKVDRLTDHVWVIDPIDGTTNFVKQQTDYGIMLAYFENGKSALSYVYLVDSGHLYYAIKGYGVYCNHHKLAKPKDLTLKESLIAIGIRENFNTSLLETIVNKAFDIRYYGSSAVDGTRTITGNLGAFINPAGGPWDFAPFILFAEELGLTMSNFAGEPLKITDYSDFIIASASVYQELKEELQAYTIE